MLQPISATAYQAEQAAANAAARASKLDAIDSILWNQHPAGRRGEHLQCLTRTHRLPMCAVHAVQPQRALFLQPWIAFITSFAHAVPGTKVCRSLARHAAYQLISRLTVDVQNVSAAFALDAPIASLAAAAAFAPSGVWVASGGAASSSAPAALAADGSRSPAPAAVRFEGPVGPLGSCARLSLRSLTVNSATPQGYGVLATVCQLSGVDLTVDRAAGAAGGTYCMLHI